MKTRIIIVGEVTNQMVIILLVHGNTENVFKLINAMKSMMLSIVEMLDLLKGSLLYSIFRC